MIDIAVAVIGIFGAVAAAWVSASMNSKRLRSDLETNHGLRPGQYLEMVADVHVAVKELARTVNRHHEHIHEAMAAHEQSDQAQFSMIHSQLGTLLDGQRDLVTEVVDG